MSQEDQTALESLEAEARSPEAGLLPVELVIALAQSRAQAKEGRYQEAVSALHVTLRNAYERKALDRSFVQLLTNSIINQSANAQDLAQAQASASHLAAMLDKFA